ncbi:dTDP-4-dehydrorhamnose 3,5-epimerase-like enzyme [Pedobacter sp. UYEF25]
MLLPTIISGDLSEDTRGSISFVNDFSMESVKRFYVIKHSDTSIIRGWRGHKIEQRWFYVSQGIFQVKIVKIDDWDNPSKTLQQISFDLDAAVPRVLHVPTGYATCLQALHKNSQVIVFADHAIDHAKNDDHLFPLNYFG